jgi:hypothetical protein
VTGAPVEVTAVPVIALLLGREDPIPAPRFLPEDRRLQTTAPITPISIEEVPVIALLPLLPPAVPAGGGTEDLLPLTAGGAPIPV